MVDHFVGHDLLLLLNGLWDMLAELTGLVAVSAVGMGSALVASLFSSAREGGDDLVLHRPILVNVKFARKANIQARTNPVGLELGSCPHCQVATGNVMAVSGPTH